VKAIVAPVGAEKPRSFFDKLNNWAKDQGSSGLGYINFEKNDNDELIGKGPIANNLQYDLIKIFNKRFTY